MAEYPVYGEQVLSNNSANTGDTGLVSVTSGTGGDVKGSWTEILSTSDAPYGGYIQIYHGDTAVKADYLVDIAIGVGGSEILLMSNILVSSGNLDGYSGEYMIPCPPFQGRISARCQTSQSVERTLEIGVYEAASGFLPSSPLNRVTTYGADTGDSGGSSVDAGATADTKGAWSTIVASTTNPIRALGICFGNGGLIVRANPKFLVDIGIGAASSEVVKIPDIYMYGNTVECMFPSFIFLETQIPVGTRIAARAQSNLTDADDRKFDILLLGYD